jgi:hypothetical protein
MPLDPSSDNHLIAIKNLTTVSTHGSGLLSVLKSVTREIIDTMGYGRVIIALKDKKSSVLRFRIGRTGNRGLEFTKLLRSIPPVSLRLTRTDDCRYRHGRLKTAGNYRCRMHIAAILWPTAHFKTMSLPTVSTSAHISLLSRS